MKTYTVNVGNIGNIDAETRKAADATFREYAKQSRQGYGRASGETVTLMIDGEPVKEFTPRPRKGSAVERLASFLASYEPETRFDVIAYELTHDGQGWSVNTPFRIASDVDAMEAVEHAANRFDVFKVNYCTRARVKDIEDTGDDESAVMLEVQQIPFLEIRPCDA